MKRVSFNEAKEITKKVLEVSRKKCVVKLPMDNVVFNTLSEIPLLEMMLNLNVVTKEHTEGVMYDKRNFQMVMRIIDGKLLMNGKPDAYAWNTSKVLKSKNKRALGFHSTEGALNYAKILSTIENEYEKEIFTNLLVNLAKDVLIIHTEAENRVVIEVTKELIEAYKITDVPNSYDLEWPTEGATDVELTPIKVGDALIIENCSFGTGFYVVQKDEYELTHIDN